MRGRRAGGEVEGDALAGGRQAELAYGVLDGLDDGGADEAVIGEVVHLGAPDVEHGLAHAGRKPGAVVLQDVGVLRGQQNDVVEGIAVLDEHAHGAGIDVVAAHGRADVHLAEPADEHARAARRRLGRCRGA